MMIEKKNLLALTLLAICTGCGAPDGPPPPLLPAITAPYLSVSDVVTLQNIQEQAVFMQSLAGLAVDHSDSDVIHAFGTECIKSYKTQQESAEKIAKDANIILDKKLDKGDQARLDKFKTKYQKIFDKDFLKFMALPLLKGYAEQLNDAKKNAKEEAFKTLAKKQLEIYEQYRQKARQIKHSGY